MVIYLLKINYNIAVKLIAILIVTEIVCGFIKLIYQKDRPTPMKNKTIFQKYYANSFPSIHTARISALLIGFGSFYTNKLLILILTLITINVAYSRIYLRKHYLIDVFAGFAIGAIISIILLMI